jgi:hypothetical protein
MLTSRFREFLQFTIFYRFCVEVHDLDIIFVVFFQHCGDCADTVARFLSNGRKE